MGEGETPIQPLYSLTKLQSIYPPTHVKRPYADPLTKTTKREAPPPPFIAIAHRLPFYVTTTLPGLCGCSVPRPVKRNDSSHSSPTT